MTRDNIIFLINERKKELEKDYIVDEGYDYIHSFLEENPYSKITDFLNIDIWKFITCLYYLDNENKSITECQQIFEHIYSVLDNCPKETLSDFIAFIFTIANNEKILTLINYLEETNFIKAQKLKKAFTNDRSLMPNLKSLKKLNEYGKNGVVELLKIISEQNEESKKLFSLLITYYEINSDKEIFQKEVEYVPFRVKKKEQDRIFGKMIKDKYKVSLIAKRYESLSSFANNINAQKKQFEKNRKSELNGYAHAITSLDAAIKNGEITNAREIVKGIKNDEIKKKFLILIHEHNMKIYDTLESELSTLEKNTKAKYQAILNDHGIFSTEIEAIMHNSVEDVLQILDCLTKMKLTSNACMKVLKSSNINIVSNIKNYCDKGILPCDFICNHLELFSFGVEHNKLIENIELFSSYQINPSMFGQNANIFLLDTNILKKNIDIIYQYDLLKALKNTNNFNFFSQINLSEKIDKLLELGYETFIENSLDCLNSNNIKRLEVLKSLGGLIENDLEFNDVLTNSQFFIKDSDLDFYIPNVTVFLENKDLDLTIQDLEKYRVTPRVYDLNGNFISVLKVKRALANGKKIYQAILENSNLSQNEYDSLIDSIKSYSYKKKF